MTVQEAINYINAHTWSQWKLGLSRTKELLSLLGDPQKQLRFVHVAGSNGKGSTCAMLERILREAGYVTGFYPSPYIEDFRERIQVCGEYITEEALAAITARVKGFADSMEDHPTQFELITAIGMVYFAEKKCDIVVLEVGLGGIFDSTNIIDAPEAAVITRIGLEHTEYLGSTLAEIAANKCGIIKTGSDVVCYENDPEVMEVVRRTCAEKGCPLHIARFSRVELQSRSLEGQVFRFRPDEEPERALSGEKHRQPPHDEAESRLLPDKENSFSLSDSCYRLSLPGEYQLHNAATALTVIEVLRGRGLRIPDEAVSRGLADVKWPARFEMLSDSPLFILDGGHNPQCAQALAESIRAYLPGEKICFLVGMLADKDYPAVIDLIAPYAAAFVCLTPDSPRALSASELARYLTGRGFEARACGSAEEGIRAAVEIAGARGTLWRPVIAFGSLYMAGAVRRAFPAVLQEFQRTTGLGIVSRKKLQRAQAQRARRSLTQEERAEKSAAVCRALETLLENYPPLRRARTVFSYGAAWDEVDLEEFHRVLERTGRQICYPVCGTQGRMTAAVPAAGDPSAWRTGEWGIREPVLEKSKVTPPSEIDAVLVPCVVFDRNGGRCGHGAGYYDRFLEQLAPRIPKILVAFDAQETEEVAVEAVDVRMDLVVTESGVRYGL